MLITEFVEQVNKMNKEGSKSIKEKFITGRITRKYIPVTEKAAKINEALKYSVRDEDGGQYIDVIVNEVNFIYEVLLSYTDLTAPLDDSGAPSPVLMYDVLKSSGIDEELFKTIGKDLLEYRYLNEQAIEMWEKRNGGIRGIIRDISQSFSFLSPLLEANKEAANEKSN